MKVVINKCFGGFGLSHKAMLRYFELKGWECYPVKDNQFDFWTYWKVPKEQQDDDNYSEFTVCEHDIERSDPVLVQVVEELGEKTNGSFAELAIVEIPDGVSWKICEYDENEHIAETHRTWC